MQYKVLSPAQQAQLLRERIVAMEADHFGHQMNLDGLTAQPDPSQPEQVAAKQEAIAFAETSQATIEAAHAVAVAELEKIEQELPSTEG